jgi:polyisoprenoid-binding protein YceI
MEITMTRTHLFVLTAALSASIGANAVAQDTTGMKMSVRPESKVMLEGGSNLHGWACRSTNFTATIELDNAFQTEPLTNVAKPITRVGVAIPVKSLDCGHNKMNDNMYKALKAAEYPEIKYVLSTYTMTPGLVTADSFTAQTTGELTVAGKSVKVEIPITGTRLDGGAARGEGKVQLLMTDFGIKPPTALLGTLRTKNEIEISFKVLLDKSTVVALSQK